MASHSEAARHGMDSSEPKKDTGVTSDAAEPNRPAPHARDQREAGWLKRAVLYPDVYAWYVLFASLDIMLTWVILKIGGNEVNFVARYIINNWGLPGVVAFKLITVMFVVVICEIVGRARPGVGRKLALWAVLLTIFPFVVQVFLLARFGFAAE